MKQSNVLFLGAGSPGGVAGSAVQLLRLLIASAALICLWHETASASGWSHEAVRETRAREGGRQGGREAGRAQWLGRCNGPPADVPSGAGVRRLRDLLSLRGGDADWAHGGNDVLPDPEQIRDSGSSEMADGSEWDELDEMSLHASQLALSDESPANETANNESTDPGLLAERYWALPAESRQLLDDLVRTRWELLANASLAYAVLEPHENDTEPQTGMKLEAVWNGDEQICVRVVEAESRSGVQAGDILKTVEGIDCSKKSLAEVGHLIAEANRDKLSVQIGMLRNGTQGQGGGGEGGGGARLRRSCIRLLWNVVG